MAIGQVRFTIFDLQCTITELCGERHFLAAGAGVKGK